MDLKLTGEQEYSLSTTAMCDLLAAWSGGHNLRAVEDKDVAMASARRILLILVHSVVGDGSFQWHSEDANIRIERGGVVVSELLQGHGKLAKVLRLGQHTMLVSDMLIALVAVLAPGSRAVAGTKQSATQIVGALCDMVVALVEVGKCKGLDENLASLDALHLGSARP